MTPELELFRVAPDGVVRSARTGKVIVGTPQQGGYLRCSFRIPGAGRKTHTALMHRIVAMHLVPNPHGHPDVNHDDGNKANNHPSNLEWVTKGENMQHAWDTGLCQAYERTDAHRAQFAAMVSTQPRGPLGNCVAA